MHSPISKFYFAKSRLDAAWKRYIAQPISSKSPCYLNDVEARQSAFKFAEGQMKKYIEDLRNQQSDDAVDVAENHYEIDVTMGMSLSNYDHFTEIELRLK